MHDYIRGAFQALTWIREVAENLRNDSERFDKLIKLIDEALNDIEHRIAVDFRWRIRSP
jgi:hypothetical protein